LFTNVRQVVYQLSNQRQKHRRGQFSSRDIGTDVVFQIARAVNSAGPAASPGPAQTASGPSAKDAPEVLAAKPTTAPAVPSRIEPGKACSIGRQKSHFAGLSPRDKPFEVVGLGIPRRCLGSGLARRPGVGRRHHVPARKRDLPGVVDRIAAIASWKQVATNATQTIKTGPDDQVIAMDSLVQIELSDVKGRALIPLQHNGTGRCKRSIRSAWILPLSTSSEYSFAVKVGEPFGADQIVESPRNKRMTELETGAQSVEPATGRDANHQDGPALCTARCAYRLDRNLHDS